MIEGKISVIIPAYNCQAWIEECLDPIAVQTYQKMFIDEEGILE